MTGRRRHSSPGRVGTDSESTLSPRRKVLFTAVMVLFPLTLLILLEAALRVFSYGGNLDLVMRRKVGNRELYSINRSVANRYFTGTGTTVPEPADDTFEIHKETHTKRIFCLGESTMAGFPYEFHATAPGFLRDRLQASLPGSKIEVVNVGLSAVGSYVVLDFIKELLEYEPDLFVVYVGHNEFYGAYGVGSTVNGIGGPLMTRLSLSLLRFRTFLLVRDAYLGVVGMLSSAGVQPGGTMMQQMAAEKTIPYRSTLYDKALDIYRENIVRIIDAAQSRNIPIIVGALISNVKDQPPFVSVFSEHTSREARQEWASMVAAGDSTRNPVDAVLKYRRACEIDTLNAEAFYKLGRTLYAVGAFDEARRMLIRAKDMDALRFRATEEFQQTLIRTCLDRHVPLARMDSAFALSSPHGIVGNELILEHLHPTVDGYFLMAKTFAAAIRASGTLARNNEWRNEPTDLRLMDLSTVSDFDRIVGGLKVRLLKQRWPFSESTIGLDIIPRDSVEEIALRYIRNTIGWSDARYALSEYYARNNQFALARRECLAVQKVIPFSYNSLLRVADYYRMEGKTEEAVAAYRECITVEDNPYARIKLGIVYLETERALDAMHQFDTVFSEHGAYGASLSSEASSAARYLFAVSYAKLGNFAKAKQEIQHALAANPGNKDATDLLRQIDELSPPSTKR